MTVDPRDFLTDTALADLAAKIDSSPRLPWPQSGPPADTIWMGAIDGEGRAVSFIQSIYLEFGSGVVAGDTGVLWQNRGAASRSTKRRSTRWRPACARSHAEPSTGPLRRWPRHALWHHGRRRPATDAGSGLQPIWSAGAGTPSGGDRAAAGSHLGSQQHQPENRIPDRRRRDRGLAHRWPRCRGGPPSVV